MKHVFIVTGASRGIGAALARQCAGEENLVITTSRSPVTGLKDFFTKHNTDHQHIAANLSDTGKVMEFAEKVFGLIREDSTASLVLINNAGMLEPVAPAGQGDEQMVASHIQLNLAAPMLLTSALIRKTRDWDIPKTILNISSGAAFNPYYGWSSYSSSKAGLAMFTRVVAIEQEEAKNPVRILAIGPGVVDTQMQDIIRSKKHEEFMMLDKFIELKEKGLLQDPDNVAERLMKVLADDRIPSGTVTDLRDLE